ncbi:hypothetical protein JCM24511_02356 [Saitozyma sp. JCM 24511]|nr:hypothetical protein JCM24511_02356 [Saitozyma sp. JCM 24511]
MGSCESSVAYASLGSSIVAAAREKGGHAKQWVSRTRSGSQGTVQEQDLGLTEKRGVNEL